MAGPPGTSWDGEQVLAASTVPMAVVDGTRFLAANRACADLYGSPGPEALAGEAWGPRLAEEDRERLTREALPECRAGGGWRGAVTGRRPDGGTFVHEVALGLMDADRYVWVARGPHLPETAVDATDDLLYVVDGDDAVVRWSDRLGYADDEVDGMDLGDLLPGCERAVEAPDRARELDLLTADGETVPHDLRAVTAAAGDAGVRYRVGVARDVAERERRGDEAEALARADGVLLATIRDLFESPTREAVERTVCDHLAESDLYRFAWVGEPESGSRRIVPRVSAGVDGGYVEAVTVAPADADAGRGPAWRAFRTGEVQVSHDVRADPAFEPWRGTALARGIRSAAAVPLVHGDTSHGVLAVYADRPLAFGSRERAGFETLGRAAGFAVGAIENRKLLFADAVVELEFEVADPDLVFVRAADRLDCELAVAGCVASESGGWSVFLRVEGASPTALRDAVADDPDVDRVRVIAGDGDGGLVEFVTREPALGAVPDHGATVTAGHVDAGRGRFCVEVPRTADVRRLLARLRTEYPEATLVARRELDRPVRRAVELRQSVEDRLTGRQREALSRAYHSGYFDWPRRSTAGDVAESMDVASTTFHYHLRHALGELLAAVFEPEDG